MTTFNTEINDLLTGVSKRIPDGYEVTISIVTNEVSISLTGPDGDYVEVCIDDLDFKSTLERYAQAAAAGE